MTHKVQSTSRCFVAHCLSTFVHFRLEKLTVLVSRVRFFFCAASDLTDSDNCPLSPLLGWSFLMSFMCLYMRSRSTHRWCPLNHPLGGSHRFAHRGDGGLDGGWMEVDEHSSDCFEDVWFQKIVLGGPEPQKALKSCHPSNSMFTPSAATLLLLLRRSADLITASKMPSRETTSKTGLAAIFSLPVTLI